MSNPRIEVDVVANVAGVASGVSAATSQLDKLGKAAQTTAPKFEQLSKATSRYNGIGIDFARVIQDAPFGIIGVGNNIQQLAQSFSSLGNAGDSVQSKVKLAFRSIFSSGNLLVLAVSAITTALTFAEKGFFKTENASKSLSDRLEEYRKTLDAVTRTSIEGQANAAKEIQSFTLLKAQAENTTISQKKRNEAVAQLQKQYPEYLKGLTEEQIKTGQVGEAYNQLTKGLIATAKARAASDQIAKNSLDTLTLLAQEEQRALDILAARDKLQSIVANKGKVTGQDLVALRNQEAIQQGKINDLIKEQLDSADQRNKIEAENSKLLGTINNQISQGATFNKASGKEIDLNKEKLKEFSKGWDEYNLQQETASTLQDKLTFGIKDYEKSIISTFQTTQKAPIVPDITGDNAWDQYTMSVYQFQKAAFDAGEEVRKSANDALEFGKKINSIEGKEVKIDVKIGDETAGPTPFQNFIDLLALQIDKLPELETRVAEFAFNIADILDVNIYEAFADLGTALGDALATGGNVLSAVGKSLLSSVGKLLGDFGKQLIAFGVAGLAYSKLIKSLFTDPVTAAPKAGLAIAAGVALVAISGAIGATMRGNASGGGGSGAGGGSAAPAGSSFTGGGVGGLFQSQRDLNGELVVRGQDLVYVFGEANNKINKG